MMRGVMAGAALLMIAMVPAKAQDVAAGERSWAKCRVCHQIGENAKNAVGPHLNGMFGRQAGTVEGYNYSAQNKASGITWTDEVFAEYIRDPRAKIPGTKMVFAGIKNDKEIADLTAFIKQFGPDGKKQ
jgi:cytochrome c